MEDPRLEVKSELKPPAYATATATWDPSHVCNLHQSSQQCQIPDALTEARDRTHILMDSSQIHFHCVTKGTPEIILEYALPTDIWDGLLLNTNNTDKNLTKKSKSKFDNFFGHTHSMGKFPSQGSNPRHSSDLSNSSVNAKSLSP